MLQLKLCGGEHLVAGEEVRVRVPQVTDGARTAVLGDEVCEHPPDTAETQLPRYLKHKITKENHQKCFQEKITKVFLCSNLPVARQVYHN